MNEVQEVQQTEPATTAAPMTDLATRLKQYRLERRLSWPKYAKALDISMTTLIKVATGKSQRPHETTLAHLERGLARLIASGQ